MQLSEFKQTGKGASTRFVTPVSDASGGEEFELTIDSKRTQEAGALERVTGFTAGTCGVFAAQGA